MADQKCKENDESPNPIPCFEHALGILPASQSISNRTILPEDMRWIQAAGLVHDMVPYRMRFKNDALRDQSSRGHSFDIFGSASAFWTPIAKEFAKEFAKRGVHYSRLLH